jgi:DNA-binding SARP family transcriptional activator
MNYRILGSLCVDGIEDLQGHRDRREGRILAALLLCPNRTVPVTDLVDLLWPEAPPATARQQVQNCTSALRRRAMRAGVRPPRALVGAYVLELDTDQLDALLFEQWVHEGRRARASNDLATAVDRLTAALGLWRGDVLGGNSMGAPFDAAVARLQELRLAAKEDLFDLALHMGMSETVLSDLIACAQENPLREKLTALLMRALAGSGRPAEAMDLFHTSRRMLVTNYGIEPSGVLTSAYAQILLADEPAGVRAAPFAVAASASAAPSRPGIAATADAARATEAVRAAMTQLELARNELQRALDTVSQHIRAIAV